MHVTVRLFAGAREAAGRGDAELSLEAGATVADARRALARGFPALSERLAGCATAVNRKYARDDVPLADGDELAVLPPVSGG